MSAISALATSIAVGLLGIVVGAASTYITNLLMRRKSPSDVETIEIRSSSGKLLDTIEVKRNMSPEETDRAATRIRELEHMQVRHSA